MNFKFIIILKFKVKLIINIIIIFINNNIFIITFIILLNDIIFNIVINILQIEKTNEMIVIIQKEENIFRNAEEW